MHFRLTSFRHLLVLAAVFLTCSVPLAAESASLGLEEGALALKAEGGRSLDRALDDSRAAARPKALIVDAATTDLLFPVLGKIPGWQSDVMLINHRSVAQALHIYFLAQGQNNASATPYTYTLPANRMVYWHDFFGTGLGISNGLGAIMILAVNSAGNADSQALINGSARLFQTDTAGGTLSQLFPSVPVHDVPSGARATAVGLRSDAQFRTNAGAVNLDSVARTFTVNIVAATVSTFTFSVPPYSMIQTRIPNDGSYGDIALQFTSTATNFWSAYAASVDNISGDSWSAHVALEF